MVDVVVAENVHQLRRVGELAASILILCRKRGPSATKIIVVRQWVTKRFAHVVSRNWSSYSLIAFSFAPYPVAALNHDAPQKADAAKPKSTD